MKIIDKNVSTYETLQKGFNLRWPPNVEQGAETIYICTTPDEVFAATNTALAAGNRITVRSGGHCYEGFVSNKLSTERLSIIDLGEMSGLDYDEDKTITSLWDANKKYLSLQESDGESELEWLCLTLQTVWPDDPRRVMLLRGRGWAHQRRWLWITLTSAWVNSGLGHWC